MSNWMAGAAGRAASDWRDCAPASPHSIRSRPSVSGGSWSRSSMLWVQHLVRPGPAILVTRARWRCRQGLAPRYASANPVGFCQMIAGVLFAFGAARLDGVSVPF